jgi:hypothetical protein
VGPLGNCEIVVGNAATLVTIKGVELTRPRVVTTEYVVNVVRLGINGSTGVEFLMCELSVGPETSLNVAAKVE